MGVASGSGGARVGPSGPGRGGRERGSAAVGGGGRGVSRLVQKSAAQREEEVMCFHIQMLPCTVIVYVCNTIIIKHHGAKPSALIA